LLKGFTTNRKIMCIHLLESLSKLNNQWKNVMYIPFGNHLWFSLSIDNLSIWALYTQKMQTSFGY